MPRRFAIASISCFCSLLTAQTTWTVPTNAPTLQAAIDQAQPGDTITTLANYIDAGNVVLGKAVTLLGCRVHCGDNQFGLRINGIAGGSRIELRNCTIVNIGDGFFGNGLTPIEALSINLPPTAAGSIVFDNVHAFGGVAKSGPTDSAALHVRALGSATLVARNCTFTGRDGAPLFYQSSGEFGPPGGHACVIDGGATGVFQDCVFVGGLGGMGTASSMQLLAGSQGGAGILASSNTALVRCSVTDGEGGAATAVVPPLFPPPNPCAMAAAGGASQLPADCFDVTWQPARIGAVFGCGLQPPIPPAQTVGPTDDVILGAATYTTGQQIVIQVAARANDFAVWLGAGLQLGRAAVPGIVNPLWAQQIELVVLLGPPNAGGLITPTLPTVPAGLGLPIDFVVQTLHATTSGQFELGGPRIVTLRP